MLIWNKDKVLWESAGFTPSSAQHCPNVPVRSEISAMELSPGFPGPVYLGYLLPTIDFKDL